MATTKDNINYRVVQGDTFLKQLQYMYVDESGNTVPYQIGNFNFELEVRNKPAGDILCATCSLNDGISIEDADNGIINLEISAEKTRHFTYPRAAYQLKSIDEYGVKETWLQGWFDVNPGVIE
jgi:hypothetical protein